MIDGWSATADGNLESWKIGAKILKQVQDDWEFTSHILYSISSHSYLEYLPHDKESKYRMTRDEDE